MRDRSSSHHPAAAWIDLDRIRDNFRAIQAYAGARTVIPVLKAEAYGHGAAAVARALTLIGASRFAVAYVDEAVALRQAGISSPLLVLAGFAPQERDALIHFDLIPVVSTDEQLRGLDGVGARCAAFAVGDDIG